tara:strand:- start:27367 stop:30393 length:3027 start_codon:yes stop_codon:yes gene_type:complete
MLNYRIFFFLLLPFSLIAQSWKPQNGSKDIRDHYTAFTNATIVVKPGEIKKNATLLIRNNRIEAVGNDVSIPANTVIIDATDKFIYPSFIDLYSQYGIEKYQNESKGDQPQLESNKPGQYYWNEAVKPEVKAIDLFKPDEKAAEKLRKMGFGAVLTHQQDGIIRGSSTFATLGEMEDDQQILSAEAALHYSLSKGLSKQSYPTSLMGVISLIRQIHYDLIYYQSNPKAVDFNRSIQTLIELQDLPKIIEVANTASIFRAAEISKEFDFKFIVKGSGQEYERIPDLQEIASPIIIPVNYPKAYDVSDPYNAQKLSLSKMKAWELAPFNPAVLEKAGLSFAITSEGIEAHKDFYKNLEKSLENGLSRKQLLASLTTVPAKLIGADSRLGSLEMNKLANFFIATDSLFTADFQIHSNWIQGKEFLVDPISNVSLTGNYSLNINKNKQFDLKVEKDKKQWKAQVKLKGNDKFIPVSFSISNQRVFLTFTYEDNSYQLSGSVSDSLSRIWTGKTLIDGEWVDWAAIKTSISKMGALPTPTSKSPTKPIIPKIYAPNMAYGWDSLPSKANPVIFRNATVWTNESEGVLKNHDVFIADGEIKMLGYKINMEVMFPKYANVKEVDASGKHITCGIIDEHSHIAIEKGVNEAGQSITAEVRIGDVVDASDINIYRQLAGGVTTSQLLHGSANAIGGQSAIIKLRWGQTAEKMKIADAPGFIKFALGENVKQSNWGDLNTVRFPQTRMGVEQVFYDGFIRAAEYDQEWQLYRAKSSREKQKDAAPRRDLELDALAEILKDERFITCHSYIQSEINMLMHVADSLNFRINTFTHILEGYKVADKLQAHGAAGSTFSDWWAYKFEVNDAIPYNGAIMHQQGVLTGFNSDDAEMGRRLNQEAAKAVKYGGVSEVEAWKFVTLNPAKMMHLDHRIGSIKAGKDADIVVWSNNPLSIYSVAEQTYIDGILYYDFQKSAAFHKRDLKEREKIIALMLVKKQKGEATQEVKNEENKLYECETIEP